MGPLTTTRWSPNLTCTAKWLMNCCGLISIYHQPSIILSLGNWSWHMLSPLKTCNITVTSGKKNWETCFSSLPITKKNHNPHTINPFSNKHHVHPMNPWALSTSPPGHRTPDRYGTLVASSDGRHEHLTAEPCRQRPAPAHSAEGHMLGLCVVLQKGSKRFWDVLRCFEDVFLK